MSTRFGEDPAQPVALVAMSKRELLLRAHRFRLRREDLEDCYSQATLELIVLARGGRPFSSSSHIANSLEQRFLARIQDRRRALSGRSPIQAALEGAVALGWGEEATDPADGRAGPEQAVMHREQLREIVVNASRLSDDQRLALACQVGLQWDCERICRAHGWSAEKYRKTAQRARARLRSLGSDEAPVQRMPVGRKGMQGPTYER